MPYRGAALWGVSIQKIMMFHPTSLSARCGFIDSACGRADGGREEGGMEERGGEEGSG